MKSGGVCTVRCDTGVTVLFRVMVGGGWTVGGRGVGVVGGRSGRAMVMVHQ